MKAKIDPSGNYKKVNGEWKPIEKIEWNDELVEKFVRIHRRGLDMFRGCIGIDEKLRAFKANNNIR